MMKNISINSQHRSTTGGSKWRFSWGMDRWSKELIRMTQEQKIDLLVMGGHGHRGLSDILFGSTVTPVRHGLEIPVLVVR